MIQAILLHSLSGISDNIKPTILNHIIEKHAKSAEHFNSSRLMVCKRYDIHQPKSTISRIPVYPDTKALLFICRDGNEKFKGRDIQ